MADLPTAAGVGPELVHEGKTYRLSLFTLGARARFCQWSRRQYLERHAAIADSLPAEEGFRHRAKSHADVIEGVADFGYVFPADVGKEASDPTRTKSFVEQLLAGFYGQAHFLRALLERHHPEADEDLAAAMIKKSADQYANAMAVVFPNAPTPAANG